MDIPYCRPAGGLKLLVEVIENCKDQYFQRMVYVASLFVAGISFFWQLLYSAHIGQSRPTS